VTYQSYESLTFIEKRAHYNKSRVDSGWDR